MIPDGSAAPGIGVFGGTFDPVHNGHLSAAREVGEALGLEHIILVPARRSPHKAREPFASPSQRLAMLRSVVENDPYFSLETLELDREGPSYTVDTLAALASAKPAARLHLIMGADQWRAFGRWRRPREIARLASIVLMARAGERPGEIDPGFGDGPPPPCVEVAITRLDISSTLVRERAGSGRSVRYLVPEGVRGIIEVEKLYLSE